MRLPIRLGIRREERGGIPWSVAKVLFESGEVPPVELSRLNLALVEEEGDVNYQAWLEAVHQLFGAHLQRHLEDLGVETKRVKADHTYGRKKGG